MKTLILGALIITLGLASCSVTQPEDVYYPQQRVYSNPNYQYDPYYNSNYDNGYSIRRVYDYNTGRYYDVKVYNAQVYNTPVYQNRNYRRDYDRREDRREYRENNVRREIPREQPRNEPRIDQTKRLPDGTTISPDGTVTLPNGQVRRSNR